MIIYINIISNYSLYFKIRMKSYPAQLNKISIFSTSFAKSKMDALLVTSKHLADIFFSKPLKTRSDIIMIVKDWVPQSLKQKKHIPLISSSFFTSWKLISVAMTWHPSFANRIAVALPIPKNRQILQYLIFIDYNSR